MFPSHVNPTTTTRGPKRVAIAALLALTACAPSSPKSHDTAVGSTPWPITDCGTYSGEGCAETTALVDLDKPTFSKPTEISNPLYPISDLDSVVLLGTVDGLPFRSETTLLPFTDIVVWDGQPIEVVLVQYMAYSDRRITEVAIDRYAQADDGSVWYFGEDVYDYRDGTIALTEGTWLAGRDGPPAMIMPASPKVGDVYRPETIVGIVFEEITITSIDEVQEGPRGPVANVVVGSELHLDESRSDKMFAPGYGEFYSAHDGDVEALALAANIDHLSEAEPAALGAITTSAWGLAEAVRLDDWEAADSIGQRLTTAVQQIAQITPPRIASVMQAALADLSNALATQDGVATVQAAIDVAQSAIDVQLRFRSAPLVDAARFHLHTQQFRLDVEVGDEAAAMSEVAALEWLHQRIALHLPEADRDHLESQLEQVRVAASTGNFAVAADIATRLAAEVQSVAAGVESWQK